MENDKISQLTLERYYLGELPVAEAKQLEQRMGAALKRESKKIELENENFFKRHNAKNAIASITLQIERNEVSSKEVIPQKRKINYIWSSALVGVMALFVIIFMVAPTINRVPKTDRATPQTDSPLRNNSTIEATAKGGIFFLDLHTEY